MMHRKLSELRKLTGNAWMLSALLMLAGCASLPESGTYWAEHSTQGQRELDPPAEIPRPLEVVDGAVPLRHTFGAVQAWRAFPLTEFESPWLIMLMDDPEVSEEWKTETRRMASLGYVVLCIPGFNEEDEISDSELNNAWGEVLLQAVEVLARLRETRGRRGGVIGFGENAARALQLSLVEPRITAAVAWKPEPVLGRSLMPDLDVSWLILNPGPAFDSEALRDWATLNGLSIYSVPFSESPSGFDSPDSTAWYSPDSDRARAAQQRFLLEQIGSTMSPSLEEISTLSGTDLPQPEVLYEDLDIP